MGGMLDVPGPLRGEQVVLHLVFERNEGSNGIKQREALGFIDHQLQVSHQHGQIHRPEEEEESRGR